jgi:hypothetical protein
MPFALVRLLVLGSGPLPLLPLPLLVAFLASGAHGLFPLALVVLVLGRAPFALDVFSHEQAWTPTFAERDLASLL